jgi:hypothetical protein
VNGKPVGVVGRDGWIRAGAGTRRVPGARRAKGWPWVDSGVVLGRDGRGLGLSGHTGRARLGTESRLVLARDSRTWGLRQTATDGTIHAAQNRRLGTVSSVPGTVVEDGEVGTIDSV